MTNLQSIAGGALWIAVATLLMLVTFEPVATNQPAAPDFVLAAAPAGPAAA